MMLTRSQLAAGLATAAVAIGSACWTIQAQDQKSAATKKASASETQPATSPTTPREVPKRSVQEAMLLPCSLPFGSPTSLEEVTNHLRRSLNAQVVLDLGALGRRKLTPQATVQLELQAVRLKTGLKLLLDQVGLTYRVVPEDNLLILTDIQGAEDPSDQILAELRALRNEVQDLREGVEELYQTIAPEAEGPLMRTPTIIEEVPAPPNEGKPTERIQPPTRSRPG